MTKREFLSELRDALYGLSQSEIEERLLFYSEMIDDRMEEGIPETEAVASLGSVVAAAEQILLDMPLPKLVKARVKPKRKLRAWEIVLIAVGSPVWFPILLALAAVVLAVYIVLFHNGVVLQNNVAIRGTTEYIGHPKVEKHGAGPIKLQSHGDPSEPISFRNIWLRKL